MKTVKDIMYSMDHTIKRVVERYRILISRDDYAEMCDRISNKINVEFINEEKQKGDIQQIYDVSFKGHVIRVVWSKANGYIKTALPRKQEN